MSQPLWYATTQKVSVAWLTAVGLAAGDTLPTDTSTWADTGFITPYATGGSSNIDVPLVQPVVTLKCWAVSPDTGVAPWNLAHNLAETVRAACFARTGMEQFLTLDHCDQQARVVNAYLIAEPRPSWADDGDYACVLVDMRLHWIVQGS